MFWIISRTYFFLFSMQNIKSNWYIIFSFFPIVFFLMENWFLSISIFFIKGLLFACPFRIFSYFFIITSYDCYSVWKAFIIFFYWWELLLLFLFLCSQDNLYMIHHDSNLFYDIYNTINKHNPRQTDYH